MYLGKLEEQLIKAYLHLSLVFDILGISFLSTQRHQREIFVLNYVFQAGTWIRVSNNTNRVFWWRENQTPLARYPMSPVAFVCQQLPYELPSVISLISDRDVKASVARKMLVWRHRVRSRSSQEYSDSLPCTTVSNTHSSAAVIKTTRKPSSESKSI